MLALDGTIGCLEAPASEVLELYRSAPLLTKPDALEAYICAIRKKKQVRVYLALIANDRNIFVYTSTSPPGDENTYREAVQEALVSAKAMGFSPEAVDLSYSAAMREVVLRNMKVLRLPGSKASPLRHGLPGAPQLPRLEPPPAEAPLRTIAPDNAPADLFTDSPTPVPVPSAQPAHDAGRLGEAERDLSAERDRLAERLQEATAENQRQAVQLQAVSAERDEQLEGLREAAAERDRLAAQLEESVAERNENAARLAGLIADKNDLAERLQQAATERDEALEALAAARIELERVSAEAGEAEGLGEQLAQAKRANEDLAGRLAELTVLHQKTEEELVRATSACDRLTGEKEALAAELAGGHAEAAQILSLQQELAELSARHEESERRCGELSDERSELVIALAAAKAQAENVCEAGAAEAAAVASAGEEARAEAAALRQENDSALQHAAVLELEKRNLEEDLHRTRAELRSLREGYLELSAAAPAPEGACAPATSALPADAPEPDFELSELSECSDKDTHVEHPQAEAGDLPDPLLSQMALREKEFAYYAALGEESTGSPAATADDFPPLADLSTIPPLDGGVKEAEPVEAAFGLTPLSELQNGFFACAGEEGPVRFALAPDLLTIAYEAAEDVVEMHQSINNANIAPDGTGQESCRGYIFGLKAGETRTVFAVIYGTQSGKARVYQPERQPWDATSYAQAVLGAVSFAEEVGLMMEQVHHPSPAKRKDYLQKCPVLSWTGHR